MAKISWVRYVLTTLLVITTYKTFAQEEETFNQQIGYYESDNVTNQIPYFDNRFRLDAKLDEITLIFYRKSGTPPIILVRPDGSKFQVGSYPKDKVRWYDDRTYDMIKIQNPMPGPWQALGDILPESKIMVLSDVSIDVVPIPEVVLAGETLKMQGQLVNGGENIDVPDFREVIKLDVDFYSTNNSAFDNFGAEPVQLTTFRDDGEALDEYSNDGIFTGEFLLDFAAGEWVPVYVVKLPMLTRELRQKPIIIQRTPITLSVETTQDKEGFHQVIFTIDPTYVDPDSILFQGKFTMPDRQTAPFSVLEGKGEQRIEKLAYTEPGIHRVNTNVFGKTIEGREFRLILPEFVFNVETQEVLLAPDLGEAEPSQELTPGEALIEKKKQAELALQAELEAQRLAAEKEQADTIFLIIVINGVIILLGLIVFIALKWKIIKAKLMRKKVK